MKSFYQLNGRLVALFVLLFFVAGLENGVSQTFNDRGLSYVINSDGVTVSVSGGSVSGMLTIPEAIWYQGTSYPVTGILEHAFECNDLITGLSLPNSLITIGESAFWSCMGLTGSLIIPNSVTSIGRYAFGQCPFNGTLQLSNSLTTIEEGVFYQCNYFTGALTIPDSVTTIGYQAFSACTHFTSLTLSNSLTLIDDCAFYYCERLSGPLIIPNSVTIIGGAAFKYCMRLSRLVLPDSLTTIYSEAFYHCTSFSGNLVIPNSVTYIGRDAFRGSRFSGGGTLTLSNSLTKIESGAFKEFSIYGQLVIPNSVTEIGTAAFSGSTFYGSLKLSNSLTTIRQGAFRNCDFATAKFALIIPSSVTMIESQAFQNCDHFSLVVSLATTPPTLMGDGMFSDISCNTLLVPVGTVPQYEASAWHNYFDIILEYHEGMLEDEENAITVFPNPTSDYVKIEAKELRRISIYNPLGQQVCDEMVSDDVFEYDFEKHEAGVYLIRVETANAVTTKRIVVE